MFSLGFGLTRLSNQPAPSASAPWTPSEISAIAWYDVSDITTLYQDTAQTLPVSADGDPVALVLDKSGNGHHLTQTTAAAQPTYRTNGASHWLELDGVSQFLKCTGVAVPATLSCVMGATVTVVPSNFASLLSMSGTTEFQMDAGSKNAGFNYRFYGTDLSALRPQSSMQFQGSFHAYGLSLNATSGLLEGRVDASAAYGTTSYNGGLSTPQTLRVFANTSETNNVGGQFFRFALWGSTDPADVAAAESWAMLAP